MTTTLPYKVVDLSPHDEDWSAYLENVLLQHAAEGWELVTGFQRQHEANKWAPGPSIFRVSSLRC